MQQKIKNQLLMNFGSVVSEQESTMAEFRCWIVIRAISTDYINQTSDSVLHMEGLNRDRIPSDADRIFIVRKIFARIECIENDWDLGPDDEIRDFVEIFYKFEDVLVFLNKIGIDTDSFIEPWNTDIPL